MCDGIYVPSGVSFDPYAIRKLTSAFEYELKWHHYLYLQIFFLRLLMPEIMLMIYSSISFDTIKVFMEEEHRKLKKKTFSTVEIKPQADHYIAYTMQFN